MNPFIGLVVKQPGRLPTTDSFARVIQGKRVAGSEYVAPQQAAKPLTEDDAADLKAAKKQAARERELAYYRARYQRVKDTPEHKAKVAAWREADREAMRKRTDDWAKANPERRQEIDRSYRMRNLEKVRARMAEASRLLREEPRQDQRSTARCLARQATGDMTMATNKKPRKKYRPKPLIQDPIAWALSGVKTMHADKGAMLAKQVRNSDALTALCQGRATKADMNVLIHMHNAVEALWQAGFGTEHSEILIRGKCALLEIGERGEKIGHYALKAQERQALDDLVALYDAQMEVATLRDVARADAKALYEIMNKKAVVIRDLEKLRLAAQQEEA